MLKIEHTNLTKELLTGYQIVNNSLVRCALSDPRNRVDVEVEDT